MKPTDLWQTPPEVIQFIERRFDQIQLDLCASEDNKVCDFFLSENDNFLDPLWINTSMIDIGELSFLNPPYSNPFPFVEMAVKWSSYGYAVAGILNSDTSTRWYDLLEKNAAVIMPIVGGRIKFIDAASGNVGKSNNKPQFMFYLAPFGRATKQAAYEPVYISEIYKGAK